jgi:hypothetical protein
MSRNWIFSLGVRFGIFVFFPYDWPEHKKEAREIRLWHLSTTYLQPRQNIPDRNGPCVYHGIRQTVATNVNCCCTLWKGNAKWINYLNSIHWWCIELQSHSFIEPFQFCAIDHVFWLLFSRTHCVVVMGRAAPSMVVCSLSDTPQSVEVHCLAA